MRQPDTYHATVLRSWPNSVEVNGRWLPARPEEMCRTWFGRFKVTWKVFTGQWDAVRWD